MAFFALSLAAAPAAAAPSFGVSLVADEAPISRSDERVDYTVTVTNVADTMVAVGDALPCDPRAASWFQSPTFTYQWVRDGISLGAANGAQTATYTVQDADAGAALQCLVLGTNSGGAALSFTDPMVVVSDPAAEPPAFPSTNPRPTIAGTGVNARTCTAPTNWIGVTEPFTFQWLRNGVPIDGANSANYTPGAEDTATNLQCRVIGSNGDGAALAVSNNSVVPTPSPTVPNNNGNNRPFIESPNSANGTVTVEVEAPAGSESWIYSFRDPNNLTNEVPPVGWNCHRVPPSGEDPAKGICTRDVLLGPGGVLPQLGVAIALGADAPDDAVVRATVSGAGAAEPGIAVDEFTFEPLREFGITAFEVEVLNAGGGDETRAGGHPARAVAAFEFPRKRRLAPLNLADERFTTVGHVKNIHVETPRGFVGNATAAPELCQSVEDVVASPTGCPPGSVVGEVDVHTAVTGTLPNNPVYAIEPEHGAPAQFAFGLPAIGTTYVMTPRLRAADGYAITLVSAPVGAGPPILGVDATLCGFGAEIGVDGQGRFVFNGCKDPEALNANEVPLITNPTRCAAQAPTTTLRVDSWENPGEFSSRSYTSPEITECEAVRFQPEIELQPTSNMADFPTGMEVELTMPTEGLEGKDDDGTRNPDAIAQANLKTAKVTLPAGMAVNASAGHGLGACTAAQFGIGANGVPNANPVACPNPSKIGTVELQTPLLDTTFEGAVYVAKQTENPFGSLLALYMAIESEERGILVKLAGNVTPDPVTGQLVVDFSDNPELPFSSVKLSFPQGPRSPLMNPPACGTYSIETELSPWSAADPNNPTPAETVTSSSSFAVTQGPGGGPCPSGALAPRLNAGVTQPVAGQPSPFVMRLQRDDGTQRFRAVDLRTPPGLSAYLRGVPYCPEAALASISAAPETAAPQIANPACPAASQVGSVQAGAGAGPNPFYVNTGRAYLAGPYKGAPLSLALVTPALAGPLDLGNVVVRTAIHIDQETAQISAVSDPIPTILHGIPLSIRDIRVAIDRPSFVLNPTNCREFAVAARVHGAGGASADLANRFQVGGCRSLRFSPRLNLRLFGGTKRGAHPRLRGVLTARPGQANIGRAAIVLPRSEFLDQGNIRTVCTRVQFAARNCPKGSIYGHARATTPLLDHPVRGPVYLRSSSNKLPDLVAVLRGPAHQPIEVAVVGRIDSIRGQIRTVFETPPDVPINRFILNMRGGNRSLLVNSRDICARTYRATVRMRGQNGRLQSSRPVLRNTRCNKQRRKR